MADLNILCHASQVDRLEGIQPSTLAHYTNYVDLVNDGVSARDDQHSFNGTPVRAPRKIRSALALRRQ